MKENTLRVTKLLSPQSIDEIARLSAQEMIKIYLRVEVAAFIERHKHVKIAE